MNHVTEKPLLMNELVKHTFHQFTY